MRKREAAEANGVAFPGRAQAADSGIPGPGLAILAGLVPASRPVVKMAEAVVLSSIEKFVIYLVYCYYYI